ncbi:MAG: SAM-dependent methyltransferase [Bacilli bacterium]|nr:SAM-dependent methyltransferase [Bacilli bacterium]
MIKLNKRLSVVASFVKDNSSVLDVGCDHAHLSIYLSQTLKNIKVTATDVNPNPLKIARENIEKYHLESIIKLKQTDGINDIDENIDIVIISGMGGILISDIINKKENLVNVSSLILSPNNEFTRVRKTLNKIHYQIVKEEIVIENKKTYLVLLAVPSSIKNNVMFGTLKNNDLNVIYYYTNLLNKNTSILKKIPHSNILRRIKIKQENKKIRKFLSKKS